MNIRTITLLWLAGLSGAALSSAYWGLNTITFPAYGTGHVNWGFVFGMTAVVGTIAAAAAIVVTVYLLIEKGGDT